jgi:hypothetical protein
MRAPPQCACAVLAILGGAATSSAQPVIGVPSTAMVFPLFDSTRNHGTFITVTNVNASRAICDNGFRRGDVCVMYTYFGFDSLGNHCNELDTLHCLSPGDTLTLIADQDNPQGEVGWLWVEARDPETLEAIDFNFLVGSAIIVDIGTNFLFQYLPFSFPSLRTAGGPVGGGSSAADGCGHRFSDFDQNGRADFDGVEFGFWPNRLILDQFFQEGGTNPNFTNEIAIATCDLDRSDGDDTRIRLEIWNNKEDRFSGSFEFECFFRGELHELSQLVRDLRGDPNELVTNSVRSLQTGWMSLDGSDPIVGVFMQRIVRTNFAAGRNLQWDFGDPPREPTPCSLPR